MDRPGETDLLASIHAGKLKRAAEQLVHVYADEVMGMCTAMVRSRTTAEDLTQDVFGRAFANLGGFRGEASVRTWLLRIARNRCIDHLRAAKRDPWGGIAPDSEEPDSQPDDAPLPADLVLRRDDVNDALAQLAEADRALVVLRFRNGLDYSELATAFGIKEGTVRMRVSRALTKMRRSLEAKHAEPARAVMEKSAAVPPGAPVSAAAAPAPAQPTARGSLGGAAGPDPLQQDIPAELEDVDDLAFGAEADEEADAFALDEAEPAAALRRRRPGFLARITDAFRSEPPPPPSGPPPQHPLTAFFAATRSPLPEEFRTRLLAHARSAEV